MRSDGGGSRLPKPALVLYPSVPIVNSEHRLIDPRPQFPNKRLGYIKMGLGHNENLVAGRKKGFQRFNCGISIKGGDVVRLSGT